MPKFFEDIVVGERSELGAHRFTAEDILRFARQFDPQRFHLSDEEAKKTHFGALCASGWHTASVWMRLRVDYWKKSEAAMRARGETPARVGGSPGFKDLRWSKPVYVDDVISYFTMPTGKRDSRTMPDWGIVSFLNEGFNQKGEKVFEFKGTAFIEKREKT